MLFGVEFCKFSFFKRKKNVQVLNSFARPLYFLAQCGTIMAGRIAMQTILRFFFYQKRYLHPFRGEIGVFMVNNKAKKMAKYAIMFATIFVAMMIDRAISFLPIGFSMAVCTLLVTLSFCFLSNSWADATFAGLFFGLASFIKEFLMPSALIGQVLPVYYWPLITIPPRLAMSLCAFAVYRGALALFKKGKIATRQIVAMSLATLVGLVCNTVGFFSCVELARFLHNDANQGVFAMIYAVLVTNIIPEYVASVAGVPLVVLGVRRGLKLGVDGNNEKRAKGEQHK